MTELQNVDGSALTPPFLANFDVVMDFTTPTAAVFNMKACLAAGAKMVVGTTGWYDRLPEIVALAERKGGALLYAANFSVGMQMFAGLVAQFGRSFAKPHGYELSIRETHHTSKLDSPSGTAKTLQAVLAEAGLQVQIESVRSGDEAGIHEIVARSADDVVTLRHEAFGRRGFALGAVKAAEWLCDRTGVYDYSDVFGEMR